MSGSAFFDTNVFVYAMVQGDPRSQKAEELIAQGGTISVQVLIRVRRSGTAEEQECPGTKCGSQ